MIRQLRDHAQLCGMFVGLLNKQEVKLSMAFDPDYIILGSGKDQVKQCGNAVTPPAMEWLVEQVVKSLK